MNKIKILILLVLCNIFLVFSAFSGEIEWKDVFKVRTGHILCVEPANGTSNVYLGAMDGLYESKDLGKSWRGVQLPGRVSEVKDVAVKGKDAVIAARSGIYIGKGGSWKRVHGKRSVSGVSIFSGPKKKDIILAWSGKDLFKITDESWSRIGSRALRRGEIIDAKCTGNVINVASGSDIFRSMDGGEKWERIPLLWKKDSSDEIGESASFQGAEGVTEDHTVSRIRNIDLNNNGDITVAATSGIFVIRNGAKIAERIDTTGLPSARVRSAVRAGEALFAATDKMVFLHAGEGKPWKPVFKKPVHGGISLLEASTDEKGIIWLWTSNGKSLFKHNADSLIKSAKYCNKESSPNGRSAGPSILEVQRMAIDYAEVSPEKIKKWRSGAKWKALMPRLSLGFSESLDDNIDIYKSSTKSYVIRGPRERGTDWDIDLTWDLSDLVWNDAQTSIDVRSKLMVQLRDEVLEEVTRLYFERKRLLAEIDETGTETGKKLREKKLHVEELTAHIDALTGGRFSGTINGE